MPHIEAFYQCWFIRNRMDQTRNLKVTGLTLRIPKRVPSIKNYGLLLSSTNFGIQAA